MRIEADEGQSLLFLLQGQTRLELPALWLRERSPHPAQCDPLTRQRLFDPHRLAEDLAVISAHIAGDELAVTFSDGHTVHFSADSLLSDFDPNEGHRQLQGCYIDRDGLRSHYRVACRNA